MQRPTVRSRLIPFLAIFVIAAGSGCGAGEIGSPSAGAKALRSTLASCDESSIAAAAPLAAQDFLSRAFDWVNRGVPYCECVSGNGGAYRTDCSGFVSYSWNLPAPGDTTYSLAGGPWDSGHSVEISWSQLQPGDALNNPGDPSAGTGHVMLFGGWLDDAHTQICTIEEHDYGYPAQIMVHNLSDWWGANSIGNYLAIRKAGYDPGTGGSAGGCPDGDGTYCGGDGVSGDANTLYQCSGGTLTVVQVCSHGCQAMPAGTADQCAAAASGPSCAGFNDGFYCGNDGVNGDASTLYQCSGGAIAATQSCSAGCSVQPAGTNDYCNTPAPSGPSCTGLNDGYYCGSDYVGGDANTLYQCSGGAIAGTQSCSAGCSVQSAGTNDFCATPAPSGPSCAGFNDGYYCGNDGVNGDASTLYQCSGGGVASSTPCAAGCSVQPAGTNDYCYAPSCAGLYDGNYCGNDAVGGDPNTLYQCSGGGVASATPCAAGCSVQPAGTNDYCN